MLNVLDETQKIILYVYFAQSIGLLAYSWYRRRYIGLGTVESVVLPAVLVALCVRFLEFQSTGILAMQIAGGLLFLLGSILGGYAFLHLTFTNSDDFWVGRKEPKDRFVVISGPYQHIRHPVYTSLGLQYLGLVLAFFHPVTLGLWCLAAILGFYTSLAEEKFLTAKFAEYSAYKEKTKRFIPKIF
jgi:protein-S-isoprenylcysteine O-methyltransferase Ste14